MNDSFSHKLYIVDTLLEVLPSEIALVVRQCLVVHWFDKDILAAFLQKMGYSSEASLEIYHEMADLPFVETRSKGLAINSSTRKGLLKQYGASQPSLFIHAASILAPIYERREQYGSIAAEAFYCYIVSNNANAAGRLLDKLLDEALSRKDWQYITCLLYVRDEALQIPFVQPFPLTEQQWTVKGLAHRVQGEQDAAMAAYLEAIKCNPRCIPHHMMLGAIYVDLERYQEAIQEYNTVIGIDARYVQAYVNKGIVYWRWPEFNQDEIILRCFEEALQIDPENAEAKAYRQHILDRLPKNFVISSSDYTRKQNQAFRYN